MSGRPLLVLLLFAAPSSSASFAPSARASAAVETAANGPPIELFSPPRETPSQPPICSFRHPLCVHASPSSLPSQALAALSAGDRVWDVLTGALSLPAPDRDLDGAWHVYLTDGVAGGGEALAAGRDPLSRFDREVTFARVERATPPGCALDIALARAMARASLSREAPATDAGSALAQAEMLARLAVPCGVDPDDSFEFQVHPERTLADPSSDAFDRGASLFYEWLDATFAREPGGLVRGLWALAPTRTPPGAWRWAGSPTGFDVLRASLKGNATTPTAMASTWDDVVVRFAIDRTRMSPSVHIAWHVPWPSHERRIASPVPVSPTGASYVMVDHAGAAAGAKLRLEAEWEDYGRMRWVVVKLDANGKTTAEVPVTSLDRGTRASMTIESLDGVDRVLVVGVNVGSTEHAFDPDQGEWEPHGWLLTLASE